MEVRLGIYPLGVHIDGSARAHLGDTYHLSKSTPKERNRSRMLGRSQRLDSPLHRLPYAVESPCNVF